jgi:hypothetical protein
MRVARTLWNLLLLAVAVAATSVVLPKVVLQVATSTTFESSWVGVQGIAILAVVWLGLASLGTWAWSPIPRLARWGYALVAIPFAAGVAISAALDHAAIGFVFWHQYAAFLIAYAAIAFPLVATGVAYPALAFRALRAWRPRQPG